jgi:hypothetical protein
LALGEPLPVDRLHNLENLLGSYTYKEFDVIVNEAIANAVDAFRENSIASGKIDISLNKKNGDTAYLSFHNNAPPMNRNQFETKYHTVSFSFKEKGKGIGFAGVGAKIFLASKHGGEIITITGKGNDDFVASKMFRTKDDVRYITTKNYPLSKILPGKYIHKYGTTYMVKLSDYAYEYLKERLAGIVQFWWNYALLTRQIVIKIDGSNLVPWEPRGDKYRRTFAFKKSKIQVVYFISKDPVPEDMQHIVYAVYGKRINSRQLPLAIRIKQGFSTRVFCIVDTSILANQLVTNKEDFQKNFYTNTCRNAVEKNFWKFLEEMGLLDVDPSEPPQQMLKNELTNRLEELFKTKEFSKLNPFLTTRKSNTFSLDSNGEINVSGVPGESLGGDSVAASGNGSEPGPGKGTGYVKDENAEETAKLKERRSKGLHIIYESQLPTHKEEAEVSLQVGAVVIDINHPFYLLCKKNPVLKNFNDMRVVIEALIKFKNDEYEWNAKEALEIYRDLVHKIWR